MLYRIGIILMFIGVTMADSENLIIPVAVIAVGLALMRLGKEATYEED